MKFRSRYFLHIVDISHPNFEEQIDTVNKTLHEIGASDKKTIIVFNKIDAYKYIPKDEYDLTPKEKENYSLEDLQKMWISKTNENCIFISAKQKSTSTNLEI